MGGANNNGGHVNFTNLLVFEKSTGGLSVCIPTAIENTVVVVLMNSAMQLHGTVGCENLLPSNNVFCNEKLCWSMRFIPYCRKRIVSFIEERKKC